MALVAVANAQDAPNQTVAAPPVTDCDTYASNAEDPDHVSATVFGDKLESAKAIPACEAAVLKGYPNSRRLIYQLGRSYWFGTKDYEYAIEMYQMAANLGSAGAQHDLATAYYSGTGVPQSYSTAFSYFYSAAKLNFRESQRNVGYMYLFGQGVQQSVSKSFDWYNIAAQNGDGASIRHIAVAYLFGEGVNQDTREAAKYFLIAIKRGDTQALSSINDYKSRRPDFYKKLLLSSPDLDGLIAAAPNVAKQEALESGPVDSAKVIALLNSAVSGTENQASVPGTPPPGRDAEFTEHAKILVLKKSSLSRKAKEDQASVLANGQVDAPTPNVGPGALDKQKTISPVNSGQSDEDVWTSCRSSAYSKPPRASILAKTPPVPNNLTILQLADGTKISPQQTALISALENDAQECDKTLSKTLAAKAPGISVAFETMLSKDQDSWVELVQKKIGWGDLNQKRKQHYLDYQSQKKIEIDKAQASERQSIAEQEARKQAGERQAQQAKQAEDARVAQQQREEQMREQRREACLNQVTKNTVSGIFDLAGGGGGDLDLFGGAIMQGLQAGAAEAQCNRQ